MRTAAVRPFPSRRLTLVSLVFATLALAAVTGASAGLVNGILNPCSTPLSQPFLPWADHASFGLVPNGDFETGGAGWTLSGGAAIGTGNESFQVGGASDAQSLTLPPGGSAVSTQTCLGTLSSTMRLFAHNAGDPASSLRVDVLYTDALGVRWSLPVASLTAGDEWGPTAPFPVLATVTALPLLTGGSAWVAFRLTAVGGATWQIDDLYVDPSKGT
jgi:hypothetical protein